MPQQPLARPAQLSSETSGLHSDNLIVESQQPIGTTAKVNTMPTCFKVLCNLSDKPLERQLSDEQLCRLLVFPDLTQGHCSRPVPVRLQCTQAGIQLSAISIHESRLT